MENGFEGAQLDYCLVVYQYLTSIPDLYLILN